MEKNEFSAVILAGGQGKRMKSPLPKVLHPAAGYPMIQKTIEAVQGAGAEDIRIVVGHSEKLVRQMVEPLGVTCFRQTKPLGTADAVRSAGTANLEGNVLVLNGDHPLLTSEHLLKILKEFQSSQAEIAVVTSRVKSPGNLGRIVRHQGNLRAIVEAADASAETLKIKEVNSGIYVLKAEVLNELLPKIDNYNLQKEYYFTEIIALGLEEDYEVQTIHAPSVVSFGVNTQAQLAKATQYLFRKKNKELMDSGVVIIDPNNTYIESKVEVGEGTVIYPGTYLRGITKIGNCCVVEPHTQVNQSCIADSVQIRANTHLEGVEVKRGATIGPYARLRPGTIIDEEAHVGNFVEMKKTYFGKKAKAGHLTYLGDAEIGEGSNIGCGTITCNYAVDKKKYKTLIGKGVFIGSDSQFIAPVEVGDRAVIGSGSTVTKNVPARALAVARSKQVVKENYVPETTPDAQKKEVDEASSR